MLSLALLSVFFYLAGYKKMVPVYAGLACQGGATAYRGLQIGRLPIIGPHDTLFFMALSTALFATAITYKQDNRMRMLYPMLVLAVLFTGLSLAYPPHDTPLPPVLNTFWFESHVVLSFFSYALFGIAAVLGCVFLVWKEQQVEALQYKAILVGYCFFSTAMIFGGIWAFYAWGTYWLWTPKELFTVILWLFYSLHLHARLRPSWAGKPTVILGIAGFAIVMFTYLGVSLFMKSSHSF